MLIHIIHFIALPRIGHYKNYDEPFAYIIHRTFHRPRDIIQFCLKLQSITKKKSTFDRDCIYKAEKLYTDWLLDEISNEIATVLGDTKYWYSFLRNFPRKVFP